MTDQETLFPPGKPAAPPRPLTSRQQNIYHWICQQPDGVTAVELGQHLHAEKLKHPATEICIDCGQDGARTVREKAIRARVVRRATGIYEPRDHADWTGRAELGVPPPPSAQMRELAGTTWQDAFHPKGEAA